MYTPDNWVIIKIEKEDTKIFKVLAGWSGGYLDGDSWQLNSGIAKVEKDGDYFLFHGYSGSIYKCHKEAETLRMNNVGTWNQMKERYPDLVEIVPVEEIQL
jgi:hypothetical protein